MKFLPMTIVFACMTVVPVIPMACLLHRWKDGDDLHKVMILTLACWYVANMYKATTLHNPEYSAEELDSIKVNTAFIAMLLMTSSMYLL